MESVTELELGSIILDIIELKLDLSTIEGFNKLYWKLSKELKKQINNIL